MPDAADQNETRFFTITGFMKSGTNWVGGLLATHDDVEVVGEFHWNKVFEALTKNLETLPVFHDEGYQDHVRRQFDAAVKSSLLTFHNPAPKVIGERTPRPIEPLVLRDDPVINIIRDGRDVMVSRAFHIFNNPQVHRLFERVPPMRRDFERFQKNKWYFQKNPERLLCHKELITQSAQWWAQQLKADRQATVRHPNLRVHVVKYEELHADVETQRTKLFEFIGVDPSKCSPISGAVTPGFKQEEPNKFHRKGKVGDWENYFNDDVKKIFNEHAGEEMIARGYVDSLDW